MAHIKKYKGFLSVFQGNKLLKYLGHESNYTKEQKDMEVKLAEKRLVLIGGKMKIKDLKDKMSVQDLVVEVMMIQKEREYNKQRVTSARIKDDTGEANLDLWDDDIDRIKEGQIINIKAGFAKEKNFIDKETDRKVHIFDLTKGNYGEIEVLKEAK